MQYFPLASGVATLFFAILLGRLFFIQISLLGRCLFRARPVPRRDAGGCSPPCRLGTSISGRWRDCRAAIVLARWCWRSLASPFSGSGRRRLPRAPTLLAINVARCVSILLSFYLSCATTFGGRPSGHGDRRLYGPSYGAPVPGWAYTCRHSPRLCWRLACRWCYLRGIRGPIGLYWRQPWRLTAPISPTSAACASSALPWLRSAARTSTACASLASSRAAGELALNKRKQNVTNLWRFCHRVTTPVTPMSDRRCAVSIL